MWTRRETVLGGSLILLSGSGMTCSCGAAPRGRVLGCMIARDDANTFFNRSSETWLYATGEEPMIPQSGDRDFDYALAQTLANIGDTFGVSPGFAYYDDVDQMNAYATSGKRLASSHGTVLFGKRLLQHLRAGTDHPEVGVAAVCAHEFAHILQFSRDLDTQLLRGQPTVKRAELQADFMAGYFAAKRKRERPAFPAAVFAATQETFGSDNIRSPYHHGTRTERAEAIQNGFNALMQRNASLEEAIEISVNYVSRL